MIDARNIQQNIVNTQEVLKDVVKKQDYTPRLEIVNTVVSTKDEHTVQTVQEVRHQTLHIDINAFRNRNDNTNPLKHLLRNIVNEYAERNYDGDNYSDGFALWSHTLFLADKKLILSYLCDSEDYAYYCSSPTALEAGLKEHDRTIQKLIDDMCDTVYQEECLYRGYERYQDTENGEYYLV